MLTELQSILATFIVSLVIGGSVGFHFGNERYENFKAKTEKAEAIQQQKVLEENSNHEKITANIIDEYNHRIASLHNNSSGRLLSIPKASSGTDESSAYTALVVECSETTVQLNSLQEWVLAQYKSESK
jgi:hypothetical protein